jgi:hypothetical protein
VSRLEWSACSIARNRLIGDRCGCGTVVANIARANSRRTETATPAPTIVPRGRIEVQFALLSVLLQVTPKARAPSISIGAQIKVYAVSVLLPPFGLIYVWRYYKQSDRVSQRIASIALVLTILMTAATVWITIDTLNTVHRMLNAALNGSTD